MMNMMMSIITSIAMYNHINSKYQQLHCDPCLHQLNFKPSKFRAPTVASRFLGKNQLKLIDEMLCNVPFNSIRILEDVNDIYEAFKVLPMEVVDSIWPLKNLRTRKNHLPWVDNELQNER